MTDSRVGNFADFMGSIPSEVNGQLRISIKSTAALYKTLLI